MLVDFFYSPEVVTAANSSLWDLTVNYGTMKCRMVDDLHILLPLARLQSRVHRTVDMIRNVGGRCIFHCHLSLEYLYDSPYAGSCCLFQTYEEFQTPADCLSNDSLRVLLFSPFITDTKSLVSGSNISISEGLV